MNEYTVVLSTPRNGIVKAHKTTNASRDELISRMAWLIAHRQIAAFDDMAIDLTGVTMARVSEPDKAAIEVTEEMMFTNEWLDIDQPVKVQNLSEQ